MNPFSYLYKSGRMLHQAWGHSLGRCPRLPGFVICVGNLHVGGTGKSPLVRFLVEHLRQDGHEVVMASRNYRAAAGQLNDENQDLKNHFPDLRLALGGHRYRSLIEAWNKKPWSVALLDDGLQHWVLPRDLDIVLLPDDFSWQDKLLPLGRMREPYTGLKRAGAVVLGEEHHWQDALHCRQINPSLSVFFRQYAFGDLQSLCGQHSMPLNQASQQKIVVASAIGSPQHFQRDLKKLGFQVIKSVSWADHRTPALSEIQALQAFAKEQKAKIVITTKDAVKWRGLCGQTSDLIWVLPRRLQSKEAWPAWQQLFKRHGLT